MALTIHATADEVFSSYTNVTNQPTFSCAISTCLDNMIRLFHTNITAGRFQPLGISGFVSLAPAAKSGVEFFPRGAKFLDVKGVKLDVAFIENKYRDCESLKGCKYIGVDNRCTPIKHPTHSDNAIRYLDVPIPISAHLSAPDHSNKTFGLTGLPSLVWACCRSQVL